MLAHVCLLLSMTCISAAPSFSQDKIPLPSKKPTQSSGANSNSGSAGILDFTKALLDFTKSDKKSDAIPKPPTKPKQKAQTPNVAPAKVTKDKNENFAKALSNGNIAIYKKIFALQEAGKITAANTQIKKLSDHRLYGYVLQQRYLHPTSYTSTFDELRAWLDQYADHAGADRIYELAERKRSSGNNARLKSPDTKIRIARRGEPTMRQGRRYASAKTRTTDEANAVKQFRQTVTRNIRGGTPSAAIDILQDTERSKILDTVEYDILNARIAAAMLYKGQVDNAYKLASQSANRSGLHVPLASWVAGLVSWKRGKYKTAAKYFENVGRSTYASSWTRAAGSYWAARSHMRRGDVKAVSIWLNRAASAPRTFYGLIATRALGRDFDFNWDIPTFTKDNHKILSANPRGVRAIALAQINELAKAQSELLRISPNETPQMHDALLAFSAYTRLPGVAMRLGSTPADSQLELYHDAALYPLGPWKPKSGYKINSALMHAIMRQESRFDPQAESGSGAKGLMQLMPATAKSVADSGDPDMEDPSVNLELGQRYLQQLLKSSRVDNNLLSLLIAYNAGPGNLLKWKRHWSDVKDPLLFIELLPSAETRAYVERVLSNYWIYRLRENKDVSSLDAVVAGKPVKYANANNAGIQTASTK